MESQNPDEKLAGTSGEDAGATAQPQPPRGSLLDPLGLFDVLKRDVERVGNALHRPPRPGAEEAQETRAETDNPSPAAGEAGNPVEVVTPPVPPEFNSDMAGLLERKRQKWLAEGVCPNLVRMGLDQAVSGAQGMARCINRAVQLLRECCPPLPRPSPLRVPFPV